VAWTYSGDPASSTRDKVRFLCGDTDSTDQQLNDAEIAFLITEWVDAYLAAANACDAIASKFQRQSDYSKSVGDMSISTQFQAQAQNYLQRATNLRAQAMRSAPPSPNFDTTVFNGTYKFSIDMDANKGYSGGANGTTDL